MAGDEVTRFFKDPDEKLDYKMDWRRWLGADTIVTSSWVVSPGLTKVSDTKTSTDATVWLSGGARNEPYNVTNHIETAGGRISERSITIRVQDR